MVWGLMSRDQMGHNTKELQDKVFRNYLVTDMAVKLGAISEFHSKPFLHELESQKWHLLKDDLTLRFTFQGSVHLESKYNINNFLLIIYLV